MGRDGGEGGFEVTVQNRIFLGEHTEYLVRHAVLGNIIVLAPRQSEIAARAFGVGDSAFISWTGDAALVLPPD
jgi:spermidine/putrescine transport system ATP-binding protein